MQRFALTLRPLSPLHIGTGEVLDPTQYVMSLDKDGHPTMAGFDLSGFLSSMTSAQRQAFDVASRGQIHALRTFLHTELNRPESRRFLRWSCSAADDLFDTYDQELKKPRGIALEIHPFYRSGTKLCIPGSSVKGAIRTAVIQAELNDRPELITSVDRLRDDRKAASQLEAQSLGYWNGERGEIRADPFRAVQVGDVSLPGNATAVEGVTLVSARGSARGNDPSGIKQYYEITFSALDEAPIIGRGTLALREELADARVADDRYPCDTAVSGAISLQRMIADCNAFYLPRLQAEAKLMAGPRPDASASYARLLELAQSRKPSQALIRMGRFTHIQCITLARPPRRKPDGTTRTLVDIAEGAMPLGWAMLELTPAPR